ncbi:NAC transcription factor NAM-B1 [Brachypodium distachyon]|uniref:NAC domain-containing protein n=1 Tax=Brachypodium distachyon TaxID=15368 RepID=I1H5X2_BRADI|nr:NAC transcription factor NAM-B1 [Brachypodium distachyon]KQK21867.1 hypothetical protein BRADI_1g63600v3 [Brachypodium distachyon]|eukprot:XP_003557998.1 NAC transcription factor NAM-B1 [Brachypodium distachyon]
MIMSDPAMLPPGFRFHPTDEELILHYLRNRAAESPCPVSIIADVDIYKFDPWALPSKANYGDREWYFFTPRDRKYPNGVRPNRAAGSGYWKATGTDKPIRSSATSESVGVKKALVFYKGRPPKGVKTNWIMHEYRLAAADAHAGNTYRPMKFRNTSMRLDDWVLCRIYKKTSQMSPMAVPPLSDHEHDEPCAYGGASSAGMVMQGGAAYPGHALAGTQRMPKIPSISELLNEYSLAQLLDEGGAGDIAARPDQHAAFLGHPIMNQYLVNSSGSNNNNMSQLAQTAAGGEGAAGKRKRSEHGGDNGLTSQQAADKKPNGSCFGATTFQIGSNPLQGSLAPGNQRLLHF